MIPRKQMTIRLPAELLTKAKQLQAADESFNDLVVKALDAEVRRRGLKVLEEIVETSEAIFRRSGPQPDSTPFIRALRDGTEPHV